MLTLIVVILAGALIVEAVWTAKIRGQPNSSDQRFRSHVRNRYGEHHD